MEELPSPSRHQNHSDLSLLQQDQVTRDIPSELIFEILTWLPVKSLLRFRCVSKSWLSLLSDSKFIKAHLQKWSSNNDYTHHRLILHKCKSTRSYMKQCSLHSALYAPTTEATDIYPTETADQVFRIVGSCNGLVCVYGLDKEIMLWNPATKKTKRLPEFAVIQDIIWRNGTLPLGFGYDQVNDDYKVVGINSVDGWNRFLCKNEVKVHSLRTDSWKRLEYFKDHLCFGEYCGKLVNGQLHWMAYASPSSSRNKIVSFDLSNESFGEVMQPHYEEGTASWTLEVLGEWLSLFSYSEKSRVDVWIMKEYGVQDSWTKMASILDINDPELRPVFCKSLSVSIDGKILSLSRPLFVSKDGEILFQYHDVMVLFNPDIKSLKYPMIANSGALPGVNVYVESLVLPNHPADCHANSSSAAAALQDMQHGCSEQRKTCCTSLLKFARSISKGCCL